MLAASWAMDYFDTYIKGRKFKLFLDHKLGKIKHNPFQNVLSTSRANEHF